MVMNNDINKTIDFNNLNDLRTISGSIEKEFSVEETQIHIRVQQRNGRKCITTVEGIDKIDNQGDKNL